MSLKDYDYPGAYYYIGNEDMSAAGGSLEGAANLFVQHAQVMEAVDPELTFDIVNIEDEVIHTLKLKNTN